MEAGQTISIRSPATLPHHSTVVCCLNINGLSWQFPYSKYMDTAQTPTDTGYIHIHSRNDESGLNAYDTHESSHCP